MYVPGEGGPGGDNGKYKDLGRTDQAWRSMNKGKSHVLVFCVCCHANRAGGVGQRRVTLSHSAARHQVSAGPLRGRTLPGLFQPRGLGFGALRELLFPVLPHSGLCKGTCPWI